ncbi:Cysteine proteinase 1 [Dichanthelium oligosanthes]|uniref:Cysteine proteinase 1 n=1 Tax=Dichanthelium oligosanthes TaxID=888268 RepID=A0A1E5VIK5_9POAL|nr:Cysteine proteinase 1 [Dichanthelium oligosanthes]
MARRRLRLLAGAAILLLAVLFSAVALCSAEPDDASAAEDPLIEQVVGDAAGDELELNAEAHFASFVRRFGKSYRDDGERAHRMSVFKANLRRARRHQRLDPTALHGVTRFSDLTPAEFRRQFLGLRRSSSRDLLKASSAHEAPILPTDGLPTDFDWREHGAVGPVKDQGSCGSCWSFSTTGALEGAHYLATGKLEVLSEQQMVDCDHECDPLEPRSCDAGCNGGLMTTAFSYLQKSGGLESEKDYPYTGSDGTCKFDKSKIVAQVKNFSVVSVDEDQIAANLVKHGPLAIGINAVFMQTYIGGVSCPYICGRHLDHGVLLVGYGSAGYAPIRFKEKPYWIIKNSWGENWGENGYYKICRGPHVQNKCGVDSMVSTVTAIHTSKKE